MKDDLTGSNGPQDLDPTEACPPANGPHERIGHYRLLQKIGEGGMGEVYAAEQEEPIRRQVALKIIKHGMDTKEVIARFESERQALAMMDHPCIAKVFDAGATEHGRPYFVMEYVQGVPITEHCDTNRLGIRERLELFTRVCEGVQHAHQKAIIHRDIKPSNILVTIQGDKALPKIIDFGVAKATSQRLTERTMFTELGRLIGTPAYMSPEQAEMSGQNIDTRTDIYSLGVVLYELLVGALPFDPQELHEAGFDEIRRRIREDEAPRPSTRLSTLGENSALSARKRRTEPAALSRRLRGDLDWITMKALEKDRTRRYESPTELAKDIVRYLNDEPVLASPPSTTYRARKFIRRHKVGVGAVTAFLLVLMIFAATMTIQAGRIARERDRANRETAVASQVSRFLADLFKVSDPGEARGNSVTAREILDEGAARIEEILADQPEVQAHLMETMGTVYVNLGLYESAENLADQACRIRRDLHDGDHLDVARSLTLCGIVQHYRGNYEEAERLYREALEIHRRIQGERHADTAICLQDLAINLKVQGRFDEAEAAYREALTIQRQVLGNRHQNIASTLTSLGELLKVKGELGEAEMHHREALAIAREIHGEVHPLVTTCLNNLALVLQDKEEVAAAEEIFREIVEIDRKLYGKSNPIVANRMNNLAASLKSQGKLDEAEALHRQALAIRREELGAGHPDVASSLNNLSITLQAKGELEEAASLIREALQIVRDTMGADHPRVGISLYNLGKLLVNSGNHEEAAQALREAQPIMAKTLPADHWRMGYVRNTIGYCLMQDNRHAEAESLIVGGYETIRAARGDEDARTIAALERVIQYYERAGKDAEAETMRARLPETSPRP